MDIEDYREGKNEGGESKILLLRLHFTFYANLLLLLFTLTITFYANLFKKA